MYVCGPDGKGSSRISKVIIVKSQKEVGEGEGNPHLVLFIWLGYGLFSARGQRHDSLDGG